MPKLFLAVLLSSFIFSACGGGGGGSGSGGGDGSVGSLSRNSRTAVRIMHGAVDTTPVTVNVGGRDVQSARYSQTTFYQGVSEGAATVSVFRQNDPSTVFATLDSNFERETEYTLFVVSKPGGSGLDIKYLTDQVIRPASGRGFLRIVNAFQTTTVSASTTAGAVPAVAFGSASGFVEVPSGPITVDFLNSSGGRVAGGAYEVPDQGELTLMISGSEGLGVVFVQEYKDLD